MNQSESAVLDKIESFEQSESFDRISQLPDAVLGHILSFIPFKQSVQTSILSKRWLLVWTYLPLIDVDDSTLLVQPIVFSEQSGPTSFINFLSNVLNRCHKLPIDKFILKCSKFDVFRVNQWIAAAVKRRVQELDLCVTLKENFKISCCLFSYKELVSLKLGRKFDHDVPGVLLFPSLRKLHLVDIDFDDETIHNFLSGCPVLEDLDIICTTEKWNKLVIKVPTLKFFTIVASAGKACSDDPRKGFRFEFILESPYLEVLKYSGPEALKGFCFRNLNSLVKAEMDIRSCTVITNFEIGIVNAKLISLTDDTSGVADNREKKLSLSQLLQPRRSSSCKPLLPSANLWRGRGVRCFLSLLFPFPTITSSESDLALALSDGGSALSSPEQLRASPPLLRLTIVAAAQASLVPSGDLYSSAESISFF